MIEIGRICIKTAGRDAGLKCVIVDVIDDRLVMIDGQTRRRKCAIKHVEPTKTILKINKGANSEEVGKEFKKMNIEVKERDKKQKKSVKPVKKRKS